MAAYRQHQTIQHSFGRVALFRLSCFLIFFFQILKWYFTQLDWQWYMCAWKKKRISFPAYADWCWYSYCFCFAFGPLYDVTAHITLTFDLIDSDQSHKIDPEQTRKNWPGSEVDSMSIVSGLNWSNKFKLSRHVSCVRKRIASAHIRKYHSFSMLYFNWLHLSLARVALFVFFPFRLAKFNSFAVQIVF